MSIDISNSVSSVNFDNTNLKVQSNSKTKSGGFSEVLEKVSQSVSDAKNSNSINSSSSEISDDSQNNDKEDKSKLNEDDSLDNLIQLLLMLKLPDTQNVNNSINQKDLIKQVSQLLKQDSTIDLNSLNNLLKKSKATNVNVDLLNDGVTTKIGADILKALSNINSEDITNKEGSSDKDIMLKVLTDYLSSSNLEQTKEKNINTNISYQGQNDKVDFSAENIEKEIRTLVKDILSAKSTDTNSNISVKSTDTNSNISVKSTDANSNISVKSTDTSSNMSVKNTETNSNLSVQSADANSNISAKNTDATIKNTNELKQNLMFNVTEKPETDGNLNQNNNNSNSSNKSDLNYKNDMGTNSTKAKTTYQSDDKLLKSILSSDIDSKTDDNSKSDNKITKVVNFMNQFGNIKENSPVVSQDKINITKPQLAQDIIKNLNYMEVNGVKEMTVKIVPKELGEVIIKLTMDGNVMKASLTATNKEAYNILNSNLQDISNKLSEQNMKIQSFNVSIYNGDSNFMSQNSNSDNFSRNNGNRSKGSLNIDEVDDNFDLENSTIEDGTINALA